MTQKIGFTSWDELELSTPKKAKAGGNDKFLKLQQGSNQIRILTSPAPYSVHRYVPDEKNPSVAKRILSCAPNESDPLVERGINPTQRCYLGVIDRKTGSYKILDASPGLIRSIVTYLRDDDWGDPKAYDLDVKVDKQGGPANYYSVIPKPKKPLSPADLQIREQVDLDYIKRLITPPTRDEMLKKIAEADQAAGKAPAAVVPAVKAVVPKSEETAAGDDFDFPAAD